MTAASVLALPAAAVDAGTLVTGSLLVALPVAVLAGLVSFASPCVLPLVPGYLSYVTGLTGVGLAGRGTLAPVQQPSVVGVGGVGPGAPTPAGSGASPDGAAAVRLGRGQAPQPRIVAGTLLFIAGFSAVFVSYGALFGGLGGTLLAHQDVLTRLLGVVVIVLGLGFLGVLPGLQREARWHARPRRGLWGAPLLGALFGLGWTPCIGPTLAAVQTLAFTEASAARGALLSVAYCFGLGLPFLAVGLAMQRGLSAMAWARRHARAIQVTGGVCLVVLGLVLVSGLWGGLMVGLRTWVSGWAVPL